MSVLRTLFPQVHPCPVCSEGSHWTKRTHKGGVQFRRCDLCGHEYKVPWLAREIVVDGRSVVVLREPAPVR